MEVDRARRDLLLTSGILAALPQKGLAEALPVPKGAPFSVADFGAIGDGLYRPLSERFSTLSSARERYPFVTRLDQSVDYAAIQAALNKAGGTNATVYLPAGRYIITDTLLVPSYITIEGDSRGTVIDNQNFPLRLPQFANKEATSFVHVTMRNFNGHGGTHFLKVDARDSCSYNRFDGINTDLQSVTDFEFNRLEVSRFNDCNLLGRGNGYRIDVQNFPCNANLLTNVRMTASGKGAIRLSGGEVWLMIGGSIESGGALGRADITLGTTPRFRIARFSGVYFEAGNEFALRTDSSASGVSFEGCHFTGAHTPGGFAPPRFEAGSSIVEFAGNDFSVHRGKPVRGTAHMVVSGNNEGLLTSDSVVWERLNSDSGAVRGRQRPIANGAMLSDILSLAGQSGGIDEQPTLAGMLRLLVMRHDEQVEAHEVRIPLAAAFRDGVLRVSHVVTADAGPVKFRLVTVLSGAKAVLQVAATAPRGAWKFVPRFEYQVWDDGAATIAVSAN